MSTYEPNLIYARERYGAVPEAPSGERGIRYAKALMIILGADGKISEAEYAALADLGKLMGAPPQLIEETKKFDFRGAKLEEYLRGLTDGPSSRRMLYDAIQIAHADGYHEHEHQAALKAAELLGIDSAVVTAIESIVQMENTLKTTRAALLTGKK